MPTETKLPRWKVISGYVGFALASLLLSFILTFPYDALKQRLQSEAGAAGMDVTIGSMGPGFFGVTARNVRVSKKAPPGKEQTSEPMVLKSVALRPSLFPPGVVVRASALGGTIKASVGGFSTTSIQVELDELNLSEGNVKGLTGLDMAGKMNGKVDLRIPQTATAGGKATEPDLSQASGNIQLELNGVTLNGGTVHIPIPPYPDPTPIDLPKIAFGELEAKLKIEKGAGTVESLFTKGQDLEIQGSGSLKLAKRVEYSEPNLEVRLKLNPEFQKNLGMVSMGLSQLRSDPKDPSWRMGKLTGYFGRPNFR